MALPHIKNSQAGVNLYDPVNKSIFEVYFTLPEAIRAEFGKDEVLLTEHVQKVSGLDALYKAPDADTQKFMGTSRSFLKPTVGDTFADIEIEFSLNLRNGTDNYILKLFRAWAALGYDINTGKRSLKKDYCAQWLKVSIANREGDIYQEIVFKDVMINGPLSGGISDLEYSADDALALTVKFRSDWWDDKVA
jgi:hypothetical protein